MANWYSDTKMCTFLWLCKYPLPLFTYFSQLGLKSTMTAEIDRSFLFWTQTFARRLRASNKTTANSLSIPPWLSKWNEGFPANPTDWVVETGHGSFPSSQGSSSSLGGKTIPLSQPEDQAASSGRVSEVMQSTCALDKGTVCHTWHFKGCPRFKRHVLLLFIFVFWISL